MTWIINGKPAVILAPMEGVTDSPMRALLTEIGGFTHCVTEFLRISQELLPKHVYLAHADELNSGSCTPSGVPVFFQLLGGDPEKLALSALTAINLGAAGIDLNFGCPAPKVNRHDGGASLLKEPKRIYEVVRAVRQAVPKTIPVSAKLRLGWDCIDDIDHNAEQAAAGGADWITVHGRTKTQGYTPPAYWEPIGRLRRNLQIPVVANGEIWTADDFKRCRDQTGCEHFMLGRGAVANPFLGIQIATLLGIRSRAMPREEFYHPQWKQIILKFEKMTTAFSENPNYTLRRLKQWFKMADQRHPLPFFSTFKTAQNLEDGMRILDDYWKTGGVAHR